MKRLDAAIKIAKTLKKSGFIAYFAGGWVRDHIMGIDSQDIDIATNASPDQILNLFPKTISVGISFGIVIVVENKVQIEVASFRSDGPYVDGRHPKSISFSSPKEDAKRRDFTINGMFWDPFDEKILDFVSGKKDIEKKVVRTIGNPNQRFEEDRLRMIRAVRFACRFQFAIEEKTHRAIIKHAKTLFPAVAIERVFQEIDKMAKHSSFEKAIKELYELKLLQEIFPSITKENLEETKFWKSFPENTPTILFIISLFPKANLKQKTDICYQLKVSNKETKLVELMHMAMGIIKENAPVKLVEFYAKENSLLCLQIAAARDEKKDILSYHQEQRKKLSAHIERKQKNKPLITAAMLQKKGVLPGKQMGVLLKKAEEIAINKNLNDPQKVIEIMKTR